ncbi:MAG: hypothetical protein ABIO70_37320 [Pseudomonadota bacterium]
MSATPARSRVWPFAWLALAVLPVIWFLGARGEVLGVPCMDLVGHLSCMLHASMGEPFTTTMVAWPHGADLLAINGGWLDIFLGAPLVGLVGVGRAYDAVFCCYVLLAGIGGATLAGVLGASRGPSLAAGLLLQLDGFLLLSMNDGRLEQGALGLFALALAAALAAWRRPGWRWAAGAGLAGALVVYASWELAMFLGAAALLLAPWLVVGERPAGAWRRWALALGVALLVAGPWVGVFLHHASPVRDLHEGRAAVQDARIASVGLLTWIAGRRAANPPTLALLALLALPWTLRPRDRRIGCGAAAALILALVLALGPDPGWRQPGDLPALQGLGPFRAFLRLPFLGWFHTPDRLLCAWSLAAPVAAALLLERMRALRRGPLLAAALGVLMVGTAVGETFLGRYWPRGGYHVPDHPGLATLAALPGRAPVLDLPPHTHRVRVLPYQAEQLGHRQPIPYHMTNPALTTDVITPMVQEEPFFAWFDAVQAGRPPAIPFAEEHLRRLRRRGFRYLVLDVPQLRPQDRGRTVQAMRRTLGSPMLDDDGRWLCWELPEADQTSR